MRVRAMLHNFAASLRDGESHALLAALALLLLAALMPAIDIEQDSYDTLVVFDITQSMDVEDATLDGRTLSRIDFAREAARRALRQLPCGSRIGWGAFAEYRTLMLLAPIEVCAHYSDLLASLDNIDGRMRWGNSSEVAKGVFWSIRSVKEAGVDAAVLFVSDGHEAPPLRPGDKPMFDDIKPGEVGGWVLGVGGEAPQPIPRTDDEGRRTGYWRPNEVIQRSAETADGKRVPGNEHLSSLRETHLRDIAQQVGLQYATLDTPQALADAMRSPGLATPRPVPTDLRWIPALLALTVLALRFRPERRRQPAAA